MSCHRHTGSEGSVFTQFVALQRLLWGGLNLVCQDFGEGDDKSQQWKKNMWDRTRRACLLTNKNVMVLLRIWVYNVNEVKITLSFFSVLKNKTTKYIWNKKKTISTQTVISSFTSNFTSLFQGFQLHFMVFLSNLSVRKLSLEQKVYFCRRWNFIINLLNSSLKLKKKEHFNSRST